MSKQKVYFRADGNSHIGLGHVIRSCALADMLRGTFECVFFIREPLPTLREEIIGVGAAIFELRGADNDYCREAEMFSANLSGEEIVVLDGYNFDTQYQQIVKRKGCKLVCIDDIHQYHFVADVIINHSGGVVPSDYSAETGTLFCLGFHYALLRNLFLDSIGKSRGYISLNRVLICMGGADPLNATMKVLNRVSKLPNLNEIYIVVGEAYMYYKELEEYVCYSKKRISLFRGVKAREMIDLMKGCDICVASPSTVSFEYMSIGGGLFVSKTADNQTDIYNYILDSGLAFDISMIGIVDRSEIMNSINLQREMFDGNAGRRLLEIFKSL